MFSSYIIIFGLIDLDMSDYFTLQSSSGCSATTRGNPYKLCVNHCRINVREHFLASALSEYGTFCRLALSVLSRYRRSVNPYVMLTSVYILNTDGGRFFIVLFCF